MEVAGPRVATREESGVLGFPSRRGLTPRGSLECNPEIPAFPGEEYYSRAAPGKSGLHARGEGERVLALESREGFFGFPISPDGKESACNAGDPGSIPGSGRSPGEGNDNPLWSSCLENSVDLDTVPGICCCCCC